MCVGTQKHLNGIKEYGLTQYHRKVLVFAQNILNKKILKNT